MKKLICIILAIVMTVSFAACGKESPEKAADNALKAVKNLNPVGIAKYFGDDTVDDMDIDEISAEELKVLKKFLSKTSWEILGSVVDGDDATVTVKITAIDPSPIFQEVIEELRDDVLSSFLGSAPDEEEMKKEALEVIDEMISEKDVQMKTNTVELDMTLTEKGWKMDVDASILGSFAGSLGDLLS